MEPIMCIEKNYFCSSFKNIQNQLEWISPSMNKKWYYNWITLILGNFLCVVCIKLVYMQKC